jgi:hypothetical protein
MEPMHEAKQMTTGQPVGAASRKTPFCYASKARAIAQEIRPHLCVFHFELLSASLRQTIIFCAAVVFRIPPKSANRRCSAGKSEPGLTEKVPPVSCLILRETANPCSSPDRSDFRISMSRVCCKALFVQVAGDISYRSSIGIISIHI